jgi:hypothetical protein
MMKCHLVRCWRFSLAWQPWPFDESGLLPVCSPPLFRLRTSQTGLMTLLKRCPYSVLPGCVFKDGASLPLSPSKPGTLPFSNRPLLLQMYLAESAGTTWWLSRTSTRPQPYSSLCQQELVLGSESCGRPAARGRAPGTG